ncbi:MAG: lipase family protein [Solirubrobacteraceae bacterium]
MSVADTEGERADFAAGPEYGMLTLDGIRAALASPLDGLSSTTPVALMGYSGGAIATGWAAQMAPGYAADVNRLLVGATMGGVLIEPDHNLHYVEGSSTWAGVMPMALVGITRAYHIDISPYLTPYGRQVANTLKATSINNAESEYPGITWSQIAKPQYPQPETVPVFVKVANKLILGHDALPTVPLQIAQGDQGELDGTNNSQPGIGPGDGVMIAGDVRSYAREACASGDPVDYTETPLTHETTEPVWSAAALAWLAGRFAGVAAPSDCSTIAPGNPLDPVTVQPAG